MTNGARVPPDVSTWICGLLALVTAALAAAQEPEPLGEDFLVNIDSTDRTSWQGTADTDGDGNFVVVWTSGFDAYGDDATIRARRFDADGTAPYPAAGPLVISEVTTGWRRLS